MSMKNRSQPLGKDLFFVFISYKKNSHNHFLLINVHNQAYIITVGKIYIYYNYI